MFVDFLNFKILNVNIIVLRWRMKYLRNLVSSSLIFVFIVVIASKFVNINVIEMKRVKFFDVN